jgi:hypothetical protein
MYTGSKKQLSIYERIARNHSSMNKIFFKSGQWFAYEAPKKIGEEFSGHHALALEKAKANALPVLNQEVITDMFAILREEPMDGREYDWPGTMEIKVEREGLYTRSDGLYSQETKSYILSLPETTASGDANQTMYTQEEVLGMMTAFVVSIALQPDSNVPEKAKRYVKDYDQINKTLSNKQPASGDTSKQGRRYRELINYIQNVTKGTTHEHSPHTQDLLRFLNSEIDLVEKAFSYGYWSNGVSKQTSWEQFKRDNGI